MYLSGSTLKLRKRGPRSDPRRIFLILVLIAGAFYFWSLTQTGAVQPMFLPTPTATRNPQSYAAEAEAQFEAGHLKAAAKAFEQAIAADIENVDYWVALVRVLTFDERYAEALKKAEESLLAFPDNVKTNAVYAWALDRNGELDKAQATATKAIALDNNYAPAHAYYSEILNDAGFWDQGYSEAQTALKLDPNLIEARWAMGYSNEVVGLYDNAIEHYQTALELNPNLWSLYIKLGVMYRDGKQKPQEAITYFSKANALDPENVQPFLYLSRTYYQIDKSGTAIQYLEQALTKEPGNPDIYGRLGWLLFKRKNYEGAEPMLRLAIFGGNAIDDTGVPVLQDGQPVPVNGMGLSQASLVYYYTLGNLRAFLASPQNNEACGTDPDDAPTLLRAALNFAPDDQTVLGSYTESMSICERVMQGLPGATETPRPTEPPPSPTP